VLCRCCCSFAELERARPVPFAGVAVQRSGQEREKRSRGKTEGVCTLAPDFGRLGPLLFAVATAITERTAVKRPITKARIGMKPVAPMTEPRFAFENRLDCRVCSRISDCRPFVFPAL
jgi:hypothetical protein